MATTLANPSIGGTELKIPIYQDLVSITKNLTDNKFRTGDITSFIDLHLGILSAALDPLGTLIGPGVDFLMNFLVNNIQPLHDAVNYLLGDPPAITQTANKWKESSKAIADSGDAFVQSLGQVDSWKGPAAEAYKGVVRTAHGVYQETASSALGVSNWIGLVGEVVSVVRKFLWDLLKDFLVEVVKAAVAAVAAAIPTAGGSLGIFGTWFAGKMAMIAGKFTKTLSKLMTKIGNLVQKLGMSGRAFFKAAEKLRQVAGKMGRQASSSFGKSGLGSKPKLPGDETDLVPGFKDGRKLYNGMKDYATKPVDKAADAIENAENSEVDELPEGY